MAEGELDLIDIVARAQAGDHGAFDALYEHVAQPLFRYFYLRCGDVHRAEDLTGQLWVRVVEHLPAFRFPDPPAERAVVGWLYQIARRLLIDSGRRGANHAVPLAMSIMAREPMLDDIALRREEHEELRAALTQLSPGQREVLLLRFVEGRSHAEVASITGRSEGAVQVMQHRALAALARLLQRQDDDARILRR